MVKLTKTKLTKRIEVGDHFWIYISTTKKNEIAICEGIDETRSPAQGRYKFTYSHWHYNGYNYLPDHVIPSYGLIPFTKVDYILYGRNKI